METRKNNKQNIPHKSSRKKGLSVMSGVVPSMFSIGIIKKNSTPSFPPAKGKDQDRYNLFSGRSVAMAL